MYSCAEEAAFTYFLRKPLCILRLYNYDFVLLRRGSQVQLWCEGRMAASGLHMFYIRKSSFVFVVYEKMRVEPIKFSIYRFDRLVFKKSG